VKIWPDAFNPSRAVDEHFSHEHRNCNSDARHPQRQSIVVGLLAQDSAVHRSSFAPLWDKYFPAHDLCSCRLKRYSLNTFELACDQAEAELANRPVRPVVIRARRLLADDVGLDRLWRELNQGHPTPSVTVEAIWLAVRERGLAALNDPDVKARLQSCDDAARAELVRRVEKLRGAK
jgi:hypothetical protein